MSRTLKRSKKRRLSGVKLSICMALTLLSNYIT